MIAIQSCAIGQNVGLVLSGGGADGLAHIGVIKALEEHEIPIDYITGTSMGAMIGAMYSSGYSIEEIESFFLSKEYHDMIRGSIQERYKFYFRKMDDTPSLLSVKFDIDSVLHPKLPTNIFSSAAIDFEIMEYFATSAAAANYDFDSLMIPFRCVASDIASKQQVIFKNGSLSESVRASISYPFFIRPININGKLLFDGGLYNNFPADLMCEDFTPDFIIGSNVSSNAPPPSEDDIVSQVRNMLVSKTHYSIECSNGIMIEPKVNYGVFSFDKAKTVIDSGYQAALDQIPVLKRQIKKKRTRDEIDYKRSLFNAQKPPLEYDKIKIRGINEKQTYYVGKTLAQKKKSDSTLSLPLIKRNYFRLYSDSRIRSAHPKSYYNKESKLYELQLFIQKSRDVNLNVGGNFASRPISHGYLGLEYNRISKRSITASGNYTFGKLYTAGKVDIRFDFPTKIPFYIEAEGTLQKWNYFESRVSSLFLEERPSFIIQKEKFAGLNIGIPIGNQIKAIASSQYYYLTDEYYQDNDFTPSDTADLTNIFGISNAFYIERNTLNDKQFPTEGKRLKLSVRHVLGTEQTKPGSTSSKTENFENDLDWTQFKLTFDNYFFKKRKMKLGWMLEGAHSTQNFFDNYTETVIRATPFQPTIDSRALFLESFRANTYFASGIKFISEIKPTIHIRLEGYLFQPYQVFTNVKDQSISYAPPWETRYSIVSGTGVYQSPIGPLSFSINYYHDVPDASLGDDTPITFLFNFGYLIFNKRAFD